MQIFDHFLWKNPLEGGWNPEVKGRYSVMVSSFFRLLAESA